MAVIDPTTNLGRVRLKIGDYSDIPILPDTVILQTLTDSGDNVKAAVMTCAQYILASLAFKSHRKMQLLEVWGKESFDSYMEYLTSVLMNPAFSGVCPIPYTVTGEQVKHPIIEFQDNFYNAMTKPTSDERLADLACGNYYVQVEE